MTIIPNATRFSNLFDGFSNEVTYWYFLYAGGFIIFSLKLCKRVVLKGFKSVISFIKKKFKKMFKIKVKIVLTFS